MMYSEKVHATATYLAENGFGKPHVAIVLGTGLGLLADRIDIEAEVAYEEIPNFPVSTVESHVGRLIFGTLNGKKVIAMQGRFHAYEGYDQGTISFPIRVFKKLGAEILLISNAAGAVNLNFKKGELMLIEDHINLLGGSPLTGETQNRFVDLSRPYDPGLASVLKSIAAAQNIVLHEGIYACVHGPHLETRAEYRFIKMIGADAVGMSTVPEVIVANQLGLPCAAISVLTDTCDPAHLEPINIADIMAAAAQAQPALCTLFEKLIERFGSVA